MDNKPQIYFSDYFEINHDIIESYGALDISLVCDNPAFVDPFLIFSNKKYENLHNFIINYLKFLKDKAIKNIGEKLEVGDFEHYYKFPEVKQVWLGYSLDGNSGAGLGKNFGNSLFRNLTKIFSDFGDEKITKSAHIEKLCLIEDGIGIDKISDFTLNLIKNYIFEYTQEFALKNLNSKFIKEFAIKKTIFNFDTELWEDGKFKLPFFKYNNKITFVLLVPVDILTSEDNWISKNDFLRSNTSIFSSITNEEMRTKINKFFYDNLLTKIDKNKKIIKIESKKSKKIALLKTLHKYPEILDYYIKQKEDSSDITIAKHITVPEGANFYSSTEKIKESFINKKFKKINSINDCVERIKFFKQVLESNSNSLRIKDIKLQEKQLQLMFKMATFGSLFDYNSEVNNGRGPIDFLISMGSNDKIGLEFKLASNSKLKQNLQNQGDIYKKDSNLKHIIKIIFFFEDRELDKIKTALKSLGKKVDDYEIFIIDCRKKESASNIK